MKAFTGISALVLAELWLGNAQVLRRRSGHSSALAGNWIYVDGGEVSYQAGVVIPDWTNASLSLVRSYRPTISLPLNYQQLWWAPEEQILYYFGGEASYANLALESIPTPADSIWGFTPDKSGSGTWLEVLGPSGTIPLPQDFTRPAGGISANDNSHAYYVGGFVSVRTSPKVDLPFRVAEPQPGLLTFDFGSLTLTNSSDDSYFASHHHAAFPGSLLSAPSFGPGGVLLAMGGGGDYDYALIDVGGIFNNITIYDKQAQKWYWQTATGAIPQPRTGFCAVRVQGGNNSTYEVFIHGGYRSDLVRDNSADWDEIFVLSLPAFHWVRANYTSLFPRTGHKCHVVGDSQMLFIGGLDPREPKYSWNGTSDPWMQGIGIFNMSSLQWLDSYRANSGPYAPPDIINQFYSDPGSYRYLPSWSSNEVEKLFQPGPIATATTTATTSPTSSTPTSSSSNIYASPLPEAPSSERPPLSRSATAGIAIGSVTAVLLISIGIWVTLCTKRHPPQDTSVQVTSEVSDMQVNEMQVLERPLEICGDADYRAELQAIVLPVEIGT